MEQDDEDDGGNALKLITGCDEWDKVWRVAAHP